MHPESSEAMLKVSEDTNDSAEFSQKALFYCSYSHKSLLGFSAVSGQFFSLSNFSPQKLHLEILLLLLSVSFFIVICIFKI